MKDFLRETILYRRLEEDHGKGETYADYMLSGVLVREVFAVDPDMTEDGVATVYYFPGVSRCIGENGADCRMPAPKYGDMAVLHSGSDGERVLRVAEAGYFAGENGLGHIRLKLR